MEQDHDAWLNEARCLFNDQETLLADINVKAEVERETYNMLYPNHCQACEGWGGKQGREFMGMYGMSAAYAHDFDTCPECIDNGKCPRCGTENALNENAKGPCSTCQWNYNDGMPEYASW